MITLAIIESQLITIVAKSLQIPEITVKLTSSLMNDLDAESIDIMDIRFAIEQQFGFKFDFDEIKKLGKKIATAQNLSEKDIPKRFTVGSLFDYIVFKLELQDATTQG